MFTLHTQGSSRWTARQIAVVKTVAACVSVLGITVFSVQLHLNFAAAAFLLLLIILFTALVAGFAESTVASILAVGCLDFFLTPPFFSLRIANPDDWIALVAFEISAMVVSRLSTLAQREAALARERERELERIYSVSRELLAVSKRQWPGQLVLELLQRAFSIEAGVLFDASLARIASVGAPSGTLQQQAREAYLIGDDSSVFDQRTWIRNLLVNNRSIGTIALQGGKITPLTAASAASLAAIALERAHLFESESQSEAERRTEQLRAAVLDALAHEYKTPLTAILTASSGLIEIGGLLPFQTEMLSLINSETSRLSELTSRLLRMSRLDSADVRVHAEKLSPEEIIDTVVGEIGGMLAGHPLRVEIDERGTLIEADPEMVGIALSQLLQNAAKYSDPGGPITVSVSAQLNEVQITVHNLGPVIPESDRDRIFERYYRGPNSAQFFEGTGLGLSVARKVVAANRGRVWVTSEERTGNTFHLAFPRSFAA